MKVFDGWQWQISHVENWKNTILVTLQQAFLKILLLAVHEIIFVEKR